MNRLKRRAVSLLLAAVMFLGVFPPATLTALAADESIKLTGCDFTGMTYHSEALGNASIHTIQFNYAGGMTGFCGDHGKKMSRTLIGQTWGNRTEITDPTVKMMLAYYYDHTLGKFTDAAVAKGVNNVWDDDYVYYMNAWIQAVIWLYKTGQLTNPVEDCAEELMWVFNCLKGENHSSIDECTAGSDTSFRDTVQYIFTLGPETWGLADVYLYEFTGAGNENYPPELIQSVVIGNVEHNSTPESYSLTVKKVDATNTSLGLPGATFHITKQGSTESWDVTTGSGGTYTLTNLSAGTYAITETSAPDGYTIDNAGPDYVVLPSNGETTVTKVFTDTPTVTVRGSIRKVDRDNPSRGLAGATIAIQGVDNSFYGEYQTGAGGALEGLTWSSLTPGTYRAWEIAAPEGYSLDPSDVKTFRISAETPEVQLVFKNDAKVKVRLTKLDASDNPLAGAIFNIFRDGQIIATEATDANGQITISDVETGMYTFVETFAPDGYAINDQPVIVHVSQANIEGGGVISVTAVDKRLPDLTIQKKDAASGEVVPNTVFELNGVRTGYHKSPLTITT